MTLLIFATCLAAFMCGWLLGPAFITLARKFLEWDRRNLEKSKKFSKQYSIPGIWFTHPHIWDHRGEYGIVVFILLLSIWIYFRYGS